MIKKWATDGVTASQRIISPGFRCRRWWHLLDEIFDCPIFFGEDRIIEPGAFVIVFHGDNEFLNLRRRIITIRSQRFDPHAKPRVVCSVVEDDAARLFR